VKDSVEHGLIIRRHLRKGGFLKATPEVYPKREEGVGIGQLFSIDARGEKHCLGEKEEKVQEERKIIESYEGKKKQRSHRAE